MPPKEPIIRTLWFSVVMSVVSLGMLAEYTHLVLTTDDSFRRIVVLCIWGVIAIAWITVAAIRMQKRQSTA